MYKNILSYLLLLSLAVRQELWVCPIPLLNLGSQPLLLSTYYVPGMVGGTLHIGFLIMQLPWEGCIVTPILQPGDLEPREVQ